MLERIQAGPVYEWSCEGRRVDWSRSKLLLKVPVILQLLLRSELLLVKPEENISLGTQSGSPLGSMVHLVIDRFMVEVF